MFNTWATVPLLCVQTVQDLKVERLTCLVHILPTQSPRERGTLRSLASLALDAHPLSPCVI